MLASRALAVWLTVQALSEISYLPEVLHSSVHYFRYEATSHTDMGYLDYMRHYYLIRSAFLVVRIIGFSLMARWIYKGGADIVELLSPSEPEADSIQK